MSSPDEEFLVADVEIAGLPVCQLLKRNAHGPIMLAFFRPDSREEVLVPVGDFIAEITKAGIEIPAL